MHLTDANFDAYFAHLIDNSMEFKETCQNIAKGIEKKETTFVELVEATKAYLINKDNNKRSTGVAILATTLEYLPRNILDAKQLEYLCSFFVEKFKDHHTVVPNVLKAILLILTFENFPKGVLFSILNGIFENVTCQTQQPNDRLVIYKIMAALLENFKNEVTSMGPDFVYGVMSAIENERNPENLMFLFKWYPTFCRNVNLGHLTDDMFEVLSCYFPVDFQPLNSEGNTISREDLSEALSPCLCAIPDFGELCLSLVLEKLSSDLKIAKMDSLRLLGEGTSIFTNDVYLTHSTDILSSIKREIFNCNNNTHYSNICCQTLTLTISKLSLCDSAKFDKVVNNAYDMVSGNLDPKDKYFVNSHLFLRAIAVATKLSARFIMSKLKQVYIEKFPSQYEMEYQIKTIKNLVMYAKILSDFSDSNNDDMREVEQFFYNASISTDDTLKSEGYTSLGIISKNLSTDTRHQIIEVIKNSLMKKQSRVVHDSLLFCFRHFALNHFDDINKIINIQNVEIENKDSLELYLEIMSSIISIDCYTNTILKILTEKCILSDLTLSYLALKQLGLTINSDGDNAVTITYLKQVNFIKNQILWVISNMDRIDAHAHKDLLLNLSAVIATLVGYLSVSEQSVLLDELLPRVLGKHCQVSVVLIESLLARLKPKFEIADGLNVISLVVAHWCFDAEIDYLQRIAQGLVANLINKCENDTKLEQHMEFLMNIKDMYVENETVNNDYNYNFVPLITKALVMKGHQYAGIWIETMVALLKISDNAINGFSVVLSDDLELLSEKSFCTIRLLYKQRFFSEVTKLLRSQPDMENNVYLKAFCCMLPKIPIKVFASEYAKNLNLILMCLNNCNDASVLISLLQSLIKLIESDKSAILASLDMILPAMMKLFSFKDSMDVRILSIQCVEHFLNGFPIDQVSPYKSDVLAALTPAIADRKRLVRKIAAESRCKWFLLGVDY